MFSNADQNFYIFFSESFFLAIELDSVIIVYLINFVNNEIDIKQQNCTEVQQLFNNGITLTRIKCETSRPHLYFLS
jgi:hypothetical protein